MSQIINCRFYHYPVPPNADLTVQTFLPISEQFGWRWYRQECNFEIVTEHPEVFLSTERSFTVHGELVKQEQDVKLIPLKWTVEHGDDHATRIKVLAKDLKFLPLERWFGSRSVEGQVGLCAALIEIVALTIGLGAYVVLAYPNPDFFWSWVARNITAIGAVSLPLTIMIGGDRLSNYYEGPFARALTYSMSIILWPTVLGAWVMYIAPPMTTEPYTKYLDDLRSNAGVGAAVFVSMTPWLVVILKALGLNLFASGAKQGSELVKPFEKKA